MARACMVAQRRNEMAKTQSPRQQGGQCDDAVSSSGSRATVSSAFAIFVFTE